MKKNIRVGLIAILLVILFVGCNNEDETDNDVPLEEDTQSMLVESCSETSMDINLCGEDNASATPLSESNISTFLIWNEDNWNEKAWE